MNDPGVTLVELFAHVAVHALHGTDTLKPKDDVLLAHAAPNAKRLVETKPLDCLLMNWRFMVAGA